jgi:hypothetical protein
MMVWKTQAMCVYQRSSRASLLLREQLFQCTQDSSRKLTISSEKRCDYHYRLLIYPVLKTDIRISSLKTPIHALDLNSFRESKIFTTSSSFRSKCTTS